jgi:pimeloyl-ACP methyl ester carboxylesterase
MRADARGKGDAVLLIHGMPTNGRLWDGVVRELSRRYKCIVIDLPGNGKQAISPLWAIGVHPLFGAPFWLACASRASRHGSN